MKGTGELESTVILSGSVPVVTSNQTELLVFVTPRDVEMVPNFFVISQHPKYRQTSVTKMARVRTEKRGIHRRVLRTTFDSAVEVTLRVSVMDRSDDQR